MKSCPPSACSRCPAAAPEGLQRHGVRMDRWDYVVALAGNPNTGKSTLFNALTGLRQHTGNWPGKTIARAEGGFSYGDKRYKLVDLPGTYSLLSASPDEEIARDFILFGQPHVTVVVVDATRLERNLNLVLQVLQITNRVVVCTNLIDEARTRGLTLDTRGLARDLGVPVVPTAARQGEGVGDLLRAIAEVADGRTRCRPRKLTCDVPGFSRAVHEMVSTLEKAFPGVRHAQWIATRLLEGDKRIAEAVASGELHALMESTEEDSRTGLPVEAATGAPS